MSDKHDREDEQEAARAREAPLVGSRTLHRHTKDVLDRVERGESVVILRYGRPAAALVPIDEERAQAIVFAASPQMRSATSGPPDLDAEGSGELFAVSSAETRDVDDEQQVDSFGLETPADVQIEVQATELVTLTDSQREIRASLLQLADSLDQQVRALASLTRRGSDRSGTESEGGAAAPLT